jgi:hypothetical protein
MAKRYRRNNDAGIALLIILAIGAVGQFFVGVINFIQGNDQNIFNGIGLIILLIKIIFIVRIMNNSKTLKAILNVCQNPIIYIPFNLNRQVYFI